MKDTKGRPFSFVEHGELAAYVEARLGRPLGAADVPAFNAFYDAYMDRKYGRGHLGPGSPDN